MTDNELLLVLKFFAAVTVRLGVKHLTITAYHQQTNGQVQRFNKKIAGRLLHYFSEHQTDCDQYVQPLTYTYSVQAHRTTVTTPISLVLSYQPPGLTTLDPSSAFPDNMTQPPEPICFQNRFLRPLDFLCKQMDARRKTAQACYNHKFDRTV